MTELLERRLRTAAHRAREAEAAIRVAAHFGGWTAPQLPELHAAFLAALGAAVVATRAIMERASGPCPFCAFRDGGTHA